MAKKKVTEERGRDIVTYFFTDATKNYVEKTIWSKWARSAVQRAYDRLAMGDLESTVAVVYDDFYGQDHAILVKDVLTGKVTITPLRDITEPSVAGTSTDPFGAFVKKKRSVKIRQITPELSIKLRIPFLKKKK